MDYILNPDNLVNYLKQSLKEEALVIFGWVDTIKDFDKPVISVTIYDHWPRHADLNIWANAIEKRDQIAQLVVEALEKVKYEGVQIIKECIIDFEEKGVLQPGSWKTIKKSKPVFRKYINLDLT